MRTRFSDAIIGALLVAGGAALFAEVRRFRRELHRQELRARLAEGPTHRIVVIGVGFGGISAVNRLDQLIGDDPRFEVLLIDQHNYHLFYPLLYQVATGGVEPGVLAYPARVIAREHGIRFLETIVRSIDPQNKRLGTDAGVIDYDSLILAPGSVTNFFGMSDAARNAMPLKSLADGIRLRNQVIECFERAEREIDPEQRRALLSFAIVGGGATGVELASSLSDMIYGALLQNYPRISPNEISLQLIEAQDRLLAGWNVEMSQIAANRLREHRIALHLDATVSHVGENGVTLGSGETIPAATVVWTAGVRAEPLINQLPGEKRRDGRIQVTTTMEVPGCEGTFVIGDAAAVTLPGASRPLPPTAPVAIAGGACAAMNAVHRLRGEQLQTLEYRSKGDLVSLGRGTAAADVFGMVFDGFPGWLVRRAVYLGNLVGFRNRLLVMIDWAFVTFHQRVISSFGAYAKPKVLTEVVVPAESPVRKAA